MPAARLTQIRLRNFKSIGPEEQTVDLKPLTVLIGRNNSGKSTVIQSLLLLKQTLEDPRPEVQLALQGRYVRATSLQELTHGWPKDMAGKGPEITLQWQSTLDPLKFIKRIVGQPHSVLSKDLFPGTPVEWLANMTQTSELPGQGRLTSEISLRFRKLSSAVLAESVELQTVWPEPSVNQVLMRAVWKGDHRELEWDSDTTIGIEDEHFLPRTAELRIRSRNPSRAIVRAFNLLYESPLRALSSLLGSAGFVSSNRDEIPPFYAMPTSVLLRNVLPNGGNAPELLYGRREDVVHHAPVTGEMPVGGAPPDETVISQPLKEAVNDILHYLGVKADISFEDVQEIGVFRMFFGRASLNHVGRGLGHVLPVIIASLLSDPLLGQKLAPGSSLSDYLERCPYSPILALEELESHLHPKAQTRLADFLIALARSGRQLIIETHSDHLVRRLRRLVALSERGSETEKWLLENINIVEVEQTPEGVTSLHQTKLTREGSIERWPADFMDESSDEERAIYFAAMEKTPPEAPPADESFFTDVPESGKL